MFDVFLARIRSRATALVTRAKAALWAAWRPRGVVTGFIADMTRSHAELVAENALLRQQLIVAARAVERPELRTLERGLLVMLASILPHWRDAMLLVKPDTILRWHRESFRLFWRWRSTPKSKPKPRIDAGIVELIGRMARENGLWAPSGSAANFSSSASQVLQEYAFDYFNCARPHQGIAQQVPIPSNRTSYSAGANVVAIPMLGGLHNDYRAAA